MRLPTMKQLEKAGVDAGRLLDAYEDHYRLAFFVAFPGAKVFERRLNAAAKRRQEFFGSEEQPEKLHD